MKKLLAAILMLTMVFTMGVSLTGCGGEKKTEPAPKKDDGGKKDDKKP